MKKIAFLICVWGLSLTTSLAQNNLDSIYKVWKDPARHDTIRLDALDKFIWKGYIYNQPDSAFYFATIHYNYAKEKGLKKFMAYAITTKGGVSYMKGEYSNAVDYYQQSLILKEEIGDKKGIANSFNNIGLVYKEWGNYPKAMEFYTKSLEIQKSIGNKTGIVSANINIGVIYELLGEYDRAVEQNNLTYTLALEIGDKSSMSNALSNTALVYSAQGEYLKALECYIQSLKIKLELGNKYAIAIAYNGIGLMYNELGDRARAFEYYNKSLQLFEQIKNKLGIASTFNNIGRAYYIAGNPIKANEYYFKSLEIQKQTGEKVGIARSLGNIGMFYNDQKDYAKALDYCKQALVIREELGNKKDISYVLNNLGIINRNLRNYPESIYYLTKALKIAQELGIPEQTKRATRNLALVYNSVGKIDSAIVCISLLREDNIQSLNKNYFTLSEQQKEIYFGMLEYDFGYYYDFARIHYQQYPFLADTAYNLALTNKGLALKSSNAMRIAIAESGDTTLIREYNDWLTLKKKIAKLYEQGKETKTLEDEASEIEVNLVKKSTVFSEFDKVKKLSWKEVQKSLSPNEAAIEFVYFASQIDSLHPVRYAALILTNDCKHPIVVSLCSNDELVEILGAIQGNNLAFVNQVYGTKAKAQTALYQKIWEPLEQHLSGIKTIYYSPSGLLHKVSFAAMSKSNDVFLCDAYQLIQQSSTGRITIPESDPYSKKDNFLILGGVQYSTATTTNEIWKYLPGTASETENIRNYLLKKKHSVQFLSDSTANESNFKSSAKSAKILHLSTHGFFFADPEQVEEKKSTQEKEIVSDMAFRGTTDYANFSFVNNKNPLMRSGLVLAGGNNVWERNTESLGEDGILTAQEVANLDLRNTKLVVLSACETGLGDIKGSEGVFGLQRAFKIAGANYIMMSLWQVPDKETAEFMQLFYIHLEKLKNIPAAFNQTRLHFRKKYDPYFWAAFVLIE